MSRLPGGALLIVLGLMMLWLATTGRLDRLASIWPFLTGATDVPGGAAPGGGAVGASSGIGAGVGVGVTPAINPGAFHVGEMVAALTPTITTLVTGA